MSYYVNTEDMTVTAEACRYFTRIKNNNPTNFKPQGLSCSLCTKWNDKGCTYNSFDNLVGEI